MNDTPPLQPLGRDPKSALPALVVLLLGALAYVPLLDLPMLGWDGWPLVLTSRIVSAGDVVGTFTEELMDGRYPLGHFYRPVTQLTFAFDYALWGLDTWGYRLTDLAIALANAILVATLAGRLARRAMGGAARGPRSGWAPVVAATIAGVVFVLHPIELELLAVPARRADTLCSAFVLAYLCLAPAAGVRASRARVAVLFALALAAAGAKETGVLVAPLAFGWHLFIARIPGSIAERTKTALRSSLPALVGVAVYFAVRTAVLGGIGGHVGVAGVEPVPTLVLWRELVVRTLYPQPLLGSARDLQALIALTGLALVGTIALCVLVERDEHRAQLGSIAAFLAVWSASVFALTSLADRMHDWYAMLLVAPYSVALALLAVQGAHLARSGKRAVAALALGLASPLAASHVAASRLVRPYPLLELAGKLAELQYRDLTREIEAGTPGSSVRLNPWYPFVAPQADGSDVRSLHLSWDYTIQAWCELQWPDTTFDVRRFDSAGFPAQPGVLGVQLVPAIEPPWVSAARPKQ